MTHDYGVETSNAAASSQSKRPMAAVQAIRAAALAANGGPPEPKGDMRPAFARPPNVSPGQLLRVVLLLMVGIAWINPPSLSNARDSAPPPVAARR